MPSMKRKLFRVLLVLAALLLLGIGLLWLNLSSVVRKGIETMGPKMAGCPMTVESVSLNPFTGSCGIKGLVIGNPEGFKTEHAVCLGEVSVTVDLKSLVTDRIVVREVLIEAPDVIYEMGLGSSNIGRIQKNLEESSGGEAGGKVAEKPEGGKKVQIDRLLIKDGKVHLSAKVLGGAALPIPLPEIEMKDIGKEKEGATMAEATSAVFSKLASGVSGVATKGLGALKDGIGGLFKK